MEAICYSVTKLQRYSCLSTRVRIWCPTRKLFLTPKPQSLIVCFSVSGAYPKHTYKHRKEICQLHKAILEKTDTLIHLPHPALARSPALQEKMNAPSHRTGRTAWIPVFYSDWGRGGEQRESPDENLSFFLLVDCAESLYIMDKTKK